MGIEGISHDPFPRHSRHLVYKRLLYKLVLCSWYNKEYFCFSKVLTSKGSQRCNRLSPTNVKMDCTEKLRIIMMYSLTILHSLYIYVADLCCECVQQGTNLSCDYPRSLVYDFYDHFQVHYSSRGDTIQILKSFIGHHDRFNS